MSNWVFPVSSYILVLRWGQKEAIDTHVVGVPFHVPLYQAALVRHSKKFSMFLYFQNPFHLPKVVFRVDKRAERRESRETGTI